MTIITKEILSPNKSDEKWGICSCLVFISINIYIYIYIYTYTHIYCKCYFYLVESFHPIQELR